MVVQGKKGKIIIKAKVVSKIVDEAVILGIEYLPHYKLEEWGELEYAREGDSCFDLRAAMSVDVCFDVRFKKIFVIDTGVKFDIPEGYEVQIRPRSGLAKSGISLVNSPGTIDNGYKGEISLIVINHSWQNFILKPGERIAQAVVCKLPKVKLVKVENVGESERGENRFGSTGTK